MKRSASGALHRVGIVVYPRPMTRSFRLLIAALLAGLIFLLPALAMGWEGEESEEAEVAPISVDSGAAIDIPPVDPIEAADPWTTRYLIPTILALTVVVIGGVILYYLVAIKGRYSVAAE
jgi:hypothetical protein